MSMYDSRSIFNTYFANASEKNLLIELLHKRFQPSSSHLSILDIGCHDGALMKKIVDVYLDRMPRKVTITGVEPSHEAALAFLNNTFPTNIRHDIYTGTAEDYFSNEAGPHPFNWVIASQCLYWSVDLPMIIQKIARCAESGLIVLRGKRGIYEIQSRFKSYLGNSNEKLYTAEDVQSALIQLAIPFEKEMKSTTIKLPNQGSIEMKWLISFFLQRPTSDLPEHLCKEVETWILENSSEKLIHEVCFFWLGKATMLQTPAPS